MSSRRAAWEEKKKQQIDEVISRISDEAEQIDAIAEIRGWFRPDEESVFYPTIQAYLDGRADVTQTINQITEPIDAAISANRVEDFDFLDLWYSVLHSAKRIPFRDAEGHTKLIELLQAYKTHPEPSHQGTQGTYKSFVNFGMAAREIYNDSPGGGAGYTGPEVHAWTNLHYFFARITRTHEDVFDYWTYCLWAMREALEEVHEDDEPDEIGVPGTAVQKYNAHVPAAAIWAITLGTELYEKEEDLTPGPNQGKYARGGELWNGKPEFSKARWALWKKRFREIGDMDKVSDDTRKLAKETFEAMNASEHS